MNNLLIPQQIDLKDSGSLARAYYEGTLGDINAHTWAVSVYLGGAAVDLTGATVVANIVRDDGVTVTITGSVSGNVASVILTQETYAVVGRTRGSMTILKDGQKITEALCEGLISRRASSVIVVPGTPIPDVADVLAMVNMVNSGESARVTAEASRVTAETARVAAENARSVNATNKITNGDFSNGTTGWTATNASFSIVAGADAGALLATAQNGEVLQIISGGTVVGRKYYFSARVKSATASAFLGLGSTSVVLTGDSVWRRVSAIHTATTTGHGLRLADTRTSGWTAINIDDALVIDLTATFGAGNEPSAEEMTAYLALWPNGWFNGTANLAETSKVLRAVIGLMA